MPDKQPRKTATLETLPIANGTVERVTRGTLLRVFSPCGLFWRGSFRTPSALYFGGTDLVFSACHFNESAHEGEYYSEFDDPKVEEILLQAALSLAIGSEGGMVSLYPHPWHVKLPEEFDLQHPKVMEDLGEFILASEVASPYPTQTDPPPPTRFEGPPYRFRNAKMPVELQAEILRCLNAKDHTLVRGLSAWLKGRMLLHHQLFTLEGLYSLFIAMDASFSIVCRMLREQGFKNPDAWDAGAFLNEAEGREDEGLPYFGDFYVDRVRTMHPDNKYGASPYAPVSTCDAHTLFESLREVFRLLVLGRVVDPKNYESF